MTSDVINTDCLEYMRTLPDKAFELAIADPPYGIGDKFKGGKTGKMNFNEVVDKGWDKAPGKEFFDELLRVCTNVIVWGGNYFELPPSRCWIVWDKKNPEDFSLAMCELAWTSFDRVAMIFRQANMLPTKIHPTQKPVSLYAFCLKHYAKPGDRIFDPMMGSQSSRIAAYKMGFDYVGCELDKEYFAKGCERFDRECRGLYKSDNGQTYQQTSIFDPQNSNT